MVKITTGVSGDHLRVVLDGAVLIAMLLGQWYTAKVVLSFVSRRFSAGAAQRIRLAILGFGLWLAVGFALSNYSIGPLIPLPRRVRFWWAGGSYLWFFSSTLACLIYSLRRLWPAKLRPARFDPSRRRLMQAAGGAALAAPFVVTGFGAFVQRTDFHVREIDIPLPDLPQDLHGLRMVQLSDIHLSPFLSEQELARVVDASNELKPHLALVTGDLITMKRDPIGACLRQLSRLRADAGILGCLGNHEIYAECEDYAAQAGARQGIFFLRGENRLLRFGSGRLNIAGVDYQKYSLKPNYLAGAERMVVPGAVNVLLSHNPDVFPSAAKKGYDFTVSGHTHGGQVTVEILRQDLNLARFFTPYVYGLYRLGSKVSYVTRGIGTIVFPARIGAPPEVALLRLTRLL